MNYNSAPINYSTIPLDVSVLLFSGAVLFGSRALGVGRSTSDYDIAISHKALNTLLADIEIDIVTSPLQKHFDIIPKTGSNYIIKGIKLNKDIADIIVLEHQSDVDNFITINAAVLASSSLLLLKDKKIRTKAYKKAMLANGMIRTRFYHRWFIKDYYESHN